MPTETYDATRAADSARGLIAAARRLRNRWVGHGENAHLFLMTGGWPARACFAFAGLLVIALIFAVAGVPSHHAKPLQARIQSKGMIALPEGPAPAVEPLEWMSIDPQTAREMNARIPFVPGPIPAAMPYKSELTGDDLARATDCLAAAVLYEAGNDPEGQRAVAQVILNRVRHPAFPGSVCGVVFQGSERTTGCQFTFTCDGGLLRWQPSAALWAAARAVAIRALAGEVYKPVGLATHYHTDWVVPYWSPTLDKIAQVHTHLFFRWTGWWGTPPAFRGRPDLAEPRIDKLALVSDVHKTPEALEQLRIDQMIAGLTIRSDGNAFLVGLDPTVAPEAYAAIAARLCGARTDCKVMGFDPKKMPAAFPTDIAAGSTSFAYTRAAGKDDARWDCSAYKRDAGQCLAAPAPPPAPPSVATADDPAPKPETKAEAPAAPEPAKRKRRDPCAAMRSADTQLSFCQ